MGLKVKDRNKSKKKLPPPCRQNQMICAINLCQDAIFCRSTEMKSPFLAFDESNVYINYILRDPEYIDRFCINFPCHGVFNQVDLDTNLLDNVLLTKVVVQLTKKPRNAGPHKLKLEKTTSKKKSRLKTRNSGVCTNNYVKNPGV